MGKSVVYLDHNASAPVLPQVVTAITDSLNFVGNPSSVHKQGRDLRAHIDQARSKIAKVAGAARRDVVFTGSATEALTQAIVGGVKAFKIDQIIVSAGEHMAVLTAAKATGLPVVIVPLTATGIIDQAALENEVIQATNSDARALIVLHAVNNETGVIQPIDALVGCLSDTKHILVVDAVQAFVKLPVEFTNSRADMMALSAHKIGGPAGVGALLMKAHCDEVRLVPGGGQELGRRGGTEAWPLIAGFGAAVAAFPSRYNTEYISVLSMDLEKAILRLAEDAVVFGTGADRTGNVVNFAIPGVSAAVAMMGLDLEGVSISSGSACSSGKVGRSHVLGAMGVAPELSDCALRVSFGWSSTQEDLDAFVNAFSKVLERHRKAQKQVA